MTVTLWISAVLTDRLSVCPKNCIVQEYSFNRNKCYVTLIPIVQRYVCAILSGNE